MASTRCFWKPRIITIVTALPMSRCVLITITCRAVPTATKERLLPPSSAIRMPSTVPTHLAATATSIYGQMAELFHAQIYPKTNWMQFTIFIIMQDL